MIASNQSKNRDRIVMLRHRESRPEGLLSAWGVGFNYQYCIKKDLLRVLSAKSNEYLSEIKLAEFTSQSPLNFIKTLNKVSQIQALLLSNEDHIDLNELYAGARLASLLENAITISSFSSYLDSEYFEEFEKKFCKNYALKRLTLKKIPNSESFGKIYKAELKTNNNNAVNSSSVELSDTLKRLSEKTVYDLAPTEYMYRMQASAQNLLNVSSDLSIISKTIDDKFVPVHRVMRARQIEYMNGQ